MFPIPPIEQQGRRPGRRPASTGIVVAVTSLILATLIAVPVARALDHSDTTSVDNLGSVTVTATDAGQRYVVRVADSASLTAAFDGLAARGITPVEVWRDALLGFAVDLQPTDAQFLRAFPGVIGVERDKPIELGDIAPAAAQQNPSWGLDRIDQRALPLNSTYDPAGNGGAGVTAYIIDTGLRVTHSEFTGRVGNGAYFDFGDGTGIADCNGHGTHVAGTLGGTTYGVAKSVTIVPVKAFDCTGSTSTSVLIGSIDWVTGTHAAGAPAVANLSLGGDASASLDAAVQALINDGVTVVVAAGNLGGTTCSYSPARLPDAITVAASDINDTEASFTNHGSCNDLFAPGTNIVSAGITSDTATAVKSGTSMATPHVAGAAAIILGAAPTKTPAQVWAAIDAAATTGAITECCGDPDKLLYVAPSPPPCAPGSTGILGWWKGEGTLAALAGPDLSGGVPFTTGVVGQGMLFGGTNAVGTSALPAPTTATTVEMWVKPAASQMVQVLASRWDFPSQDDSARTFALYALPGGDLLWTTDETSTRRPEELRVNVASWSNGAFHHVAATWDQTTMAVYVDGTLVGSKKSQGGTLNPAATTPFRLGSSVGLGDPFYFTGVIDEATVWGRALAPAQIASIYGAGPSGKCPVGS